MTRRIYPRIALFDNQPETGLDRQLEKVGYSLEDIDEPAGRSVCVAGDAAFSDDQLARGGVPGITESLTDLRKTHESLRTYRDARDTVFVYGHDTTNEAKLSAVFAKGNGAVL